MCVCTAVTAQQCLALYYFELTWRVHILYYLYILYYYILYYLYYLYCILYYLYYLYYITLNLRGESTPLSKKWLITRMRRMEIGITAPHCSMFRKSVSVGISVQVKNTKTCYLCTYICTNMQCLCNNHRPAKEGGACPCWQAFCVRLQNYRHRHP